MSLGKNKKKGGNQSSELYVLQLLNRVLVAIQNQSILLATEATAISTLNAIVASDQDIEILLIRDTGDSDVVIQQITNYQTGTPVVTYKKVDGTTHTVIGPLVYLDPSAVLNLVLSELTTFNTKFTSTVLTPGMLRVVAAGPASVTAGKKMVSVYNYGGATATWLGQDILTGERLTWKVDDQRDTLSAFTYDALTSALLITYTS